MEDSELEMKVINHRSDDQNKASVAWSSGQEIESFYEKFEGLRDFISSVIGKGEGDSVSSSKDSNIFELRSQELTVFAGAESDEMAIINSVASSEMQDLPDLPEELKIFELIERSIYSECSKPLSNDDKLILESLLADSEELLSDNSVKPKYYVFIKSVLDYSKADQQKKLNQFAIALGLMADSEFKSHLRAMVVESFAKYNPISYSDKSQGEKTAIMFYEDKYNFQGLCYGIKVAPALELLDLTGCGVDRWSFRQLTLLINAIIENKNLTYFNLASDNVSRFCRHKFQLFLDAMEQCPNLIFLGLKNDQAVFDKNFMNTFTRKIKEAKQASTPMNHFLKIIGLDICNPLQFKLLMDNISGRAQLCNLYLSDNNLAGLSIAMFALLMRVVRNQPRLSVLDLSNNNLSMLSMEHWQLFMELIRETSNLTELHLCSNGLDELSPELVEMLIGAIKVNFSIFSTGFANDRKISFAPEVQRVFVRNRRIKKIVEMVDEDINGINMPETYKELCEYEAAAAKVDTPSAKDCLIRLIKVRMAVFKQLIITYKRDFVDCLNWVVNAESLQLIDFGSEQKVFDDLLVGAIDSDIRVSDSASLASDQRLTLLKYLLLRNCEKNALTDLVLNEFKIKEMPIAAMLNESITAQINEEFEELSLFFSDKAKLQAMPELKVYEQLHDIIVANTTLIQATEYSSNIDALVLPPYSKDELEYFHLIKSMITQECNASSSSFKFFNQLFRREGNHLLSDDDQIILQTLLNDPIAPLPAKISMPGYYRVIKDAITQPKTANAKRLVLFAVALVLMEESEFKKCLEVFVVDQPKVLLLSYDKEYAPNLYGNKYNFQGLAYAIRASLAPYLLCLTDCCLDRWSLEQLKLFAEDIVKWSGELYTLELTYSGLGSFTLQQIGVFLAPILKFRKLKRLSLAINDLFGWDKIRFKAVIAAMDSSLETLELVWEGVEKCTMKEWQAMVDVIERLPKFLKFQFNFSKLYKCNVAQLRLFAEAVVKCPGKLDFLNVMKDVSFFKLEQLEVFLEPIVKRRRFESLTYSAERFGNSFVPRILFKILASGLASENFIMDNEDYLTRCDQATFQFLLDSIVKCRELVRFVFSGNDLVNCSMERFKLIVDSLIRNHPSLRLLYLQGKKFSKLSSDKIAVLIGAVKDNYALEVLMPDMDPGSVFELEFKLIQLCNKIRRHADVFLNNPVDHYDQAIAKSIFDSICLCESFLTKPNIFKITKAADWLMCLKDVRVNIFFRLVMSYHQDFVDCLSWAVNAKSLELIDFGIEQKAFDASLVHAVGLDLNPNPGNNLTSRERLILLKYLLLRCCGKNSIKDISIATVIDEGIAAQIDEAFGELSFLFLDEDKLQALPDLKAYKQLHDIIIENSQWKQLPLELRITLNLNYILWQARSFLSNSTDYDKSGIKKILDTICEYEMELVKPHTFRAIKVKYWLTQFKKIRADVFLRLVTEYQQNFVDCLPWAVNAETLQLIYFGAKQKEFDIHLARVCGIRLRVSYNLAHSQRLILLKYLLLKCCEKDSAIEPGLTQRAEYSPSFHTPTPLQLKSIPLAVIINKDVTVQINEAFDELSALFLDRHQLQAMPELKDYQQLYNIIIANDSMVQKQLELVSAELSQKL